MNLFPTTRLAALIDRAFDCGVEIVEAPLGGGIIIVTGTIDAVTEWINGVSEQYGMMQVHGDNATGCRLVR